MVGFPAMERAVAAVVGVGPDRLPTLRARLRHLQRLSFPPGTASGRSGRADYHLDDVYAVAFAFQLVDAYLPPATAVRLVETWWPELARPFLAMAATADRRRWAEQPDPVLSDALVVLRPRAMAGLGGDEPSGRGRVDQGMIVPLAATPQTLAERIAQEVDGLRPASLVVDVAALHDALMSALDAEHEASPAWFTAGLQEMHDGAGWSDGRMPTDGPPPQRRGGRIGDGDRFFARARQILEGVAARSGDEPVRLSERERIMMAYLKHPCPSEDWKRYALPDGWTALPATAGPGTGAFLDTLSAVLANAGVADDDLPTLRSATMLMALLPQRLDKSIATSAIDALLKGLPTSSS